MLQTSYYYYLNHLPNPNNHRLLGMSEVGESSGFLSVVENDGHHHHAGARSGMATAAASSSPSYAGSSMSSSSTTTSTFNGGTSTTSSLSEFVDRRLQQLEPLPVNYHPSHEEKKDLSSFLQSDDGNIPLRNGISITAPAKSKPKLSIPIKRRRKKICRYEGCGKYVQNNGVCMKHGATFKTCSHEGCTKYVVSAGACRTHGAKFKLCRYEGCTNQVIKGGVCARHGAKRNNCSHEGCTNQTKVGGLCARHGAKKEKAYCSYEGCNNQARRRGLCAKHGLLEEDTGGVSRGVKRRYSMSNEDEEDVPNKVSKF